MNPTTPCPPDSAIMKAWNAYQETESFKNSFVFVTTEQRKLLKPPSDPSANAITDWHRDQWAQGSMWAAFMRGWLAAKTASEETDHTLPGHDETMAGLHALTIRGPA